MAVITRAQALTRANEIRVETVAGANTAERVGSLLRDLVDSVSFVGPRVKCVQSTPQTLAANVAAAILFDGVDAYDTDSMHNPASNSPRITFATAGKYHVTFNVKLANNLSLDQGLRVVLRKGGSTDLVHAGQVYPRNTSFHTSAGGGHEDHFAVGEYIEIVATLSTAGTATIDTSPGQTHFSAHWIGE